MTDKLPYMPFYGFDYETDEQCKLLDDAEHGIYMRLLWHQWKEGSVPANPASATRAIHAQDQAAVGRMLAQFFAPLSDPARLVNATLARIRRETEAEREGKRRGGKLGRQRQLQAEPELSPGSARAQPPGKPGQPEPEPEPEPSSVLRTGAEGAPLEPSPVAWNGRAAEVIRKLCFPPDGAAPKGHDIAQDLRWWKLALRAGKFGLDIEAGLRGLPLLILELRGRKWSPARMFGKSGTWVNLFDRAVTADGKVKRPTQIGDIMRNAGRAT